MGTPRDPARLAEGRGMSENPTREIWRESVVCSILTMSEEDRDFVRSQICGRTPKWVRFVDSERLRELLPPAALPCGETGAQG